jgi:ATP-dependent Lon protease
MRLLKTRAREAIQLLPNLPPEIPAAIDTLESPSALADFIAGIIDIPVEEKQELLETLDVTQFLDKLLGLLAKRIQVLQLSKEISEQTQQTLSSQQREHILREQLRQIQKELGDDDVKSTELKELAEKIEKAGMPDDAKEQAKRELKRLERTPEASPDYGMTRTYLDWLIDLPWSKLDSERIDIAEARRILDEDHYGIEKVKRRILEFLAVRKLNPDGKTPILCFVGPPGVGKTSLGQSIARAIGRKFARISLGGVHDESEIRGHRRTYIGALPGNIIQAIQKAGTRNPVMMLDELDKLGRGFHGDPAAAMLEVLDPEQNSTFRDNYLAVPFDLSKVMFIGTANMLDNIPDPVRDRMEVIEMPGYIEDEKLAIAKRYLVKRQRESAGLTEEQCKIIDDVLLAIIRDYTREAGMRNLERQIGALCRYAAMRIAEGNATGVTVTVADLHAILGPKRFEPEIAMRTSVPGVATGLAWTPAGGYPVRGSDRHSGPRQADPHRPVGRCDEGERAGSPHSGQVTRRRIRHRCRPAEVRRPCSRAGRRHSKGRAERECRDLSGADVASDRAHDPERYRDDRRNLAARPGASDRRREGESAGRDSGRNHHRHAAGPQPQGYRGRAGKGAKPNSLRLSGARRRCDRHRPESPRHARTGDGPPSAPDSS